METIVTQILNVMSSTDAADRKVRGISTLAPRITRDSDPWKALKDGGVLNMGQAQKAAFNSVSEILAGVGIFLVPVGELESWLTCVSIPATSDKRAWIATALPLVRSLEPMENAGPWPFVRAIHRHILDS